MVFIKAIMHNIQWNLEKQTSLFHFNDRKGGANGKNTNKYTLYMYLSIFHYGF